MKPAILTINAGSSSIKFSLFDTDSLSMVYYGSVDISSGKSCLSVFDTKNIEIYNQNINSNDYVLLFKEIITWINGIAKLIAVGHRVVHGGVYFKEPTLINKDVIDKISELIPLAPLHQGHNLEAIRIIADFYPYLLQCVCFDTSFHRRGYHLAKLFALPRKLIDDGVIRYGFHGLSYEYIASVLPKYLDEVGSKKVIVGHLGNGASVCAMENCKSVASSMGFTALDGLMMGTRSGTLDPGVILYLLQEKNYSSEEILHMLYHESGLLGVSGGISSDMRKLVASIEPNAIEAVELFCFRAASEIGQLSISLGGCDALVFTAGIGENMPFIRQKICDYLKFWGIYLDEAKNQQNEVIISNSDSKVVVGVIPTNEECMIACHTKNII